LAIDTLVLKKKNTCEELVEMGDVIYLVELMHFDGTLIGLEKFTILELAEAFIDDCSESSIYCNLFEARQLDY
jgi:hypothetical protein